MTEPISRARLNLLKVISKQPGLTRTAILALPGITPADLAYLTGLDLVREREVDCFHVTHLGSQVVKRSL